MVRVALALLVLPLLAQASFDLWKIPSIPKAHKTAITPALAAAAAVKSEDLKLNTVVKAKAAGDNRRRRKTTTGPVLKADAQTPHAVLAQGRRRKTTTGPVGGSAAAPAVKSEALKLNAVVKAKAAGDDRRRRKTTTGPVLKADAQAPRAVLAQGRPRKTTTGPVGIAAAPTVNSEALTLKAVDGHVQLSAEQKKTMHSGCVSACVGPLESKCVTSCETAMYKCIDHTGPNETPKDTKKCQDGVLQLYQETKGRAQKEEKKGKNAEKKGGKKEAKKAEKKGAGKKEKKSKMFLQLKTTDDDEDDEDHTDVQPAMEDKSDQDVANEDISHQDAEDESDAFMQVKKMAKALGLNNDDVLASSITASGDTIASTSEETTSDGSGSIEEGNHVDDEVTLDGNDVEESLLQVADNDEDDRETSTADVTTSDEATNSDEEDNEIDDESTTKGADEAAADAEESLVQVPPKDEDEAEAADEASTVDAGTSDAESDEDDDNDNDEAVSKVIDADQSPLNTETALLQVAQKGEDNDQTSASEESTSDESGSDTNDNEDNSEESSDNSEGQSEDDIE